MDLALALYKGLIPYYRSPNTTCGLYYDYYPKNNPLQLTAYAGTNWAGCQDTRRSTTGWCIYFGNSLISWKYKKQERVS